MDTTSTTAREYINAQNELTPEAIQRICAVWRDVTVQTHDLRRTSADKVHHHLGVYNDYGFRVITKPRDLPAFVAPNGPVLFSQWQTAVIASSWAYVANLGRDILDDAEYEALAGSWAAGFDA